MYSREIVPIQKNDSVQLSDSRKEEDEANCIIIGGQDVERITKEAFHKEMCDKLSNVDSMDSHENNKPNLMRKSKSTMNLYNYNNINKMATESITKKRSVIALKENKSKKNTLSTHNMKPNDQYEALEYKSEAQPTLYDVFSNN